MHFTTLLLMVMEVFWVAEAVLEMAWIVLVVFSCHSSLND
jgi:hypothetical protein